MNSGRFAYGTDDEVNTGTVPCTPGRRSTLPSPSSARSRARSTLVVVDAELGCFSPRGLELLRASQDAFRPLIIHRVPIEQIAKGVGLQNDGIGVKVLVDDLTAAGLDAAAELPDANRIG